MYSRIAWAVAALLLSGSIARADIVIAVVGPMTGDYAASGEEMRRGAALAVRDLNARGGVAGQQVRLVVRDDACNPVRAATVAKALARQNVQFVAGHFCSGPSIVASEIYAKNSILQISPSSTNPALTDRAAKRGWRNVHRVCGRDDDHGRVAGKYLAANFKGKTIAILHDQSIYGKDLADKAVESMIAAGAPPPFYVAFAAGEPDYAELVVKLKEAEITVIYLGGYHVDAALLMRHAHEQGYTPQLVSSDALATDEYWKIAGPSAEGTLVSQARDPRTLPAAKLTVARFRAQNVEPKGATLRTYAAVQVWAAAAKRAGSLKMAAVSKAIRGNAYNTVIGRLTFDDKGDITNPDYVWRIWSKGRLRNTLKVCPTGCEALLR